MEGEEFLLVIIFASCSASSGGSGGLHSEGVVYEGCCAHAQCDCYTGRSVGPRFY